MQPPVYTPQYARRWSSADRRSDLVFTATWFRSARALKEECRDEVSKMLYSSDPGHVALASLLVNRPQLLWVFAYLTIAIDVVVALLPVPTLSTVWRCSDCAGIHFEKPGGPVRTVRVRGVRWLRLALIWFREDRA